MHFGATMWFTEYSISPSELAVALEERGFESLWASEHSHLPVAGNSEGTHASAAEPERPHHVGPDRPTGRGVAPQAPYPTPLAKRSLRRQTPEVGAVCGQAARTDLCGGRPVMGVPTAIADYSLFASDTLISIIGRAFPCLIRKLPKTASADTGIALMSTGSEIARARQRCHGAGAAQTMAKTPITIARLTEAAMRRRSSLYVWMLENHDIFKAVIAKAVRPNWHALAEAFAEDGQTDADGSKPTAECTRQTWWKVRKVVAARQVAQAKRQQTGSATRPV